MTDRHAYHRPGRDPAASAPRVAESDRPDPAELARQRKLATKRQPRMWR